MTGEIGSMEQPPNQMRPLRIAVLFRGPVRPSKDGVFARVAEFLNQFNGLPVEIHTYLATWRNWKGTKAADLINLDIFDNVIMQTEPRPELAFHRTIAKSDKTPGIWNIPTTYNMYYQSKAALDLIHAADDYDYIVHTRTDLQMIMAPYFDQWFVPGHYVTIHTHPNPWMCDQVGVAPAAMMQAAWDYGTLANLGRMFEVAIRPEHVLEMMIDSKNIPVRTAQYTAWQLDPNRNN